MTERGFTLIELIVGLAVAAIVMGIAVPSFKSVIESGRTKGVANDFVTAINVTRNEAITRGERVSMCKSANGTACTTSGGWQQGWIVFVDSKTEDVPGIGLVEVGESILRVFDEFSGGVTLSGNTNVENHISFLPTGFTQRTDNPSQFSNGTFTLTSGGKTTSIVFNRMGRVLVQ